MTFARPQVVALAAVVSLLAAPGVLAAPASSAAHPTKGAVYVGTIKTTTLGSPTVLRINMGVTPDGTKLRFTWECELANGSTHVKGNIPIDRTGRFKYTDPNGTWKAAGRFLSATKAHVSVNGLVSCEGAKGSTKVKLKAAGAPAAPAGPVAHPTKGGVYVGTLETTALGSPMALPINMGVTPDGTKLRFTWRCGTGGAGSTYAKRNIPVDQTGRFKYTAPNETWKVAGRFLSATKAHVSLNTGIECEGAKGSTKVKLKP